MTASRKFSSKDGVLVDQAVAQAARKRRVGPIVVASLGVGLVTATAAAAIVVAGAEEHVVTGTVLLAFALGWALLAACSVRWTDQPQRWAAVPAAFLGLVGAGLLIFAPGAATLHKLGWVWPAALLALVVWMTLHARRQLHSRTRRWLLYPMFGFLALASLGGAYETARESVDSRVAPAQGQLVDVGDHRLYLECRGSGTPTVVLEPGLGESSSAWKEIAPTIVHRTRVCMYDRSGFGWSDAAAGSRTAADLHMLLGRAGERGPYVLAGHSLGGAYVLDFAARFPAQVAGLVLLDSMTPNQFTDVHGYARFYDVLHRASGLLSPLARIGAGRGFGYGARDARAFRAEVARIPGALEDAGALDDLEGRPLIVVTAGKGQQAGWASAQDDLARLSTDSIHRVVPGATHASLTTDDAAASSRAIRDVVDLVRAEGP